MRKKIYLTEKQMLTKDGRDTPIEKITPENYIVPKGEERVYHCIIEVKQYDPRTGRKLSKPRIQKFGKKAFDTHVKSSLVKAGYTLMVLYDPAEYLRSVKMKAIEARKTKAIKEKEDFDKAVEAKVAEILARMGQTASEEKEATPKKETKKN